MKLTLTLLVTLLGVGLSRKNEGRGASWDFFTRLHESDVATAGREMLYGNPAKAAKEAEVQAASDLTSTAAVNPTQDEDSAEKTTEDASKSAEDKAETEDKATEESMLFTEEEQAMFREETSVFFDKAEELAREVVGEDLVKKAEALEAISGKDFTAEDEQKLVEVMQGMIEKFSTPEALEAIQKFADQPEVRAEVQKIGKAVEEAVVVMEGMLMEEEILNELEQAMFLEDALYMEPMFYEPMVVVMDFPENSVKPLMQLPENIEKLEKELGGNLFAALKLEKTEFDTKQAKALVEEAFVQQQPMLEKDGKLAGAELVHNYLTADNNAANYLELMFSEKKMKRPGQTHPPTVEEVQPENTN